MRQNEEWGQCQCINYVFKDNESIGITGCIIKYFKNKITIIFGYY